MALASPLSVANEFIDRAGRAGVDHMKTQKLVFLTDGFYAADYSAKLVTDRPEVWPYGPVYNDLYFRLKRFRKQPITEMQRLLNGKLPERISDIDALATIDMVWDKYKACKGPKLSEITHREGSPWQVIAKRYDYEVPEGTTIPFKMMRNYFINHAEDLTP